MTDDEQNDYQTLLSRLSRWAGRGEQVLPAGTRRIGHAPDLAPEAYMHTLFPPLEEKGVRILEEQLERELPDQLSSFYKLHNGCLFFDELICVYGLRYSYDRSDVVTMLEQPYELRTFIYELDDFFDDCGQIPFGRIGHRDEPGYKVVTINYDGQVTTWLGMQGHKKYRNIFEFLLHEFVILDAAHNN